MPISNLSILGKIFTYNFDNMWRTYYQYFEIWSINRCVELEHCERNPNTVNNPQITILSLPVSTCNNELIHGL